MGGYHGVSVQDVFRPATEEDTNINGAVVDLIGLTGIGGINLQVDPGTSMTVHLYEGDTNAPSEYVETLLDEEDSEDTFSFPITISERKRYVRAIAVSVGEGTIAGTLSADEKYV